MISGKQFYVSLYTDSRLWVVVCIFCMCFLTGCKDKPEEVITPAKLVFIDNFDGTELNTQKWGYRQLGSKRGDAYLTTEAVKFSNGILKMMAYSEPTDNVYVHYASMIATENTFKRAFGYFEARIRFSSLPGMVGAFWIQSPSITTNLPYEKAGVEIDVVEHRRMDINGYEIPDLLAHTLHWGGYGTNHQQKKYRHDNMGIANGFHTYAVEWTTDKYSFYLDGNLTQTWTRQDNIPVSQIAQYIIFSIEVQDKNWAGNIPETGFGNLENTLAYMEIDWVKVYDKKPID